MRVSDMHPPESSSPEKPVARFELERDLSERMFPTLTIPARPRRLALSRAGVVGGRQRVVLL
jgi:hypothetical protein